MNAIWICNPDFKGQGIIPLPFEKLDDLVQGRKKSALQGILRQVMVDRALMPEGEVEKFVAWLATEEYLADWCWRLLKHSARADEQSVLALIAKHAQA